MAFSETEPLINNDSKVRIDVESMARIELSDIEYLRDLISTKQDARLERIMYEVLVTKVATVFQLAMKACKYLEQDEILNDLKKNHPKDCKVSLGAVGRFRENLFHDGISFIEKDLYYPFGKVKGRGFVAIRVCQDAVFSITGVCEFSAKEAEYAITSEGIFEIQNPGGSGERWVLVESLPNIATVNYDDLNKVIQDSVSELKSIWRKLTEIRKHGDGKHEYQYLNEGGFWELIEKKDGQLTVYSAKEKTLNITGKLTVTPPEKLRIDGRKLIYE